MAEQHVVIADDHPVFRKGLTDIINSTQQWHVIAEAENGKTAVEYYLIYTPDVIILDISMGKTSGFDAAKKILQLDPGARCVMMTMYREASFCQRALSIGVKGYLLKEDSVSDIITCLEHVMQDELFISNGLNKAYCLPQANEVIATPELVLSDTELRILTAIAELKTNKEIAAEFNISLRTVQNHRQNISSKLNLSGRQVLLQFAVKWLADSLNDGVLL